MNPLEREVLKEKPAKIGFDYFHLVNFQCRSCGVYVVVKSTHHHNLLCPDCDPDCHQETKKAL